jgi:hypothetical protein
MSGDDVKYVQTILQSEGFFDATPLGNYLGKTKSAVIAFQLAHIDEFGKQLEADGKIGTNTWWALHNPNGDAQRNFIPTVEVKNDASGGDSPRHKMLAKLAVMHATGVREIPDGSNYGDGVTPIVNSCGFKHGIAWCLAAQSYVFFEVTGEKPLGAMHVGCSLFWNEAVKRGVAHRKGSYVPTPGDIAIYNYGGGLNSKGLLSGPGHAACLARLSADGQKFNTFEGNMGNRLKFGVRSMSERILIGFVNIYGDAANLPVFPRGLTDAPAIAATYANTR